MDPITINPSVPGALGDAYSTLRNVKENLDKVQVELLRTSDVRGAYVAISKEPRWQEYLAQSSDQAHWADKEDAEAWFTEARTRGLLDSNLALATEVKHLIDRKRILENDHHQLRLAINKASQPSLRPWHILDLPDEILSSVFDFVQGTRGIDVHWLLRGRHIANCRLVCQKFYRLSSMIFLPVVTVGFQASSLSRFEEISRHPIISKGVRGIRVALQFYDASLSSSFETFILHQASAVEERVTSMDEISTWRPRGAAEEAGQARVQKLRAISASWRRIAAGTQSEDLTEMDQMHLSLLRTAHQIYQRLYSDQEELHKTGSFAQRLAAARARMPCACTLDFTDLGAGPKVQMPSLFGSEDLNARLYANMLQPMHFRAADMDGFTPSLCGAITQLPVAVQDFGTPLERIEIHLTVVMSPSDLLPNLEIQNRLPSAMQQLQHFSFRCLSWRNEVSRHATLYSILAPFLDTPSIRELSISMGSKSFEDSSVFDVSNLLTLQRWPNLSHVYLSGVCIHLSDFQIFLDASCNPSTSLELSSIWLLSGTWEVLLDGLHQKPLRSIRLRDPKGGVSKNLSFEEFSEIFGRGSIYNEHNDAELYAGGTRRENPLRPG